MEEILSMDLALNTTLMNITDMPWNLSDDYNSYLSTNIDLQPKVEERGFILAPVVTAVAIFIFVTVINSLIIYVIARYQKLRTASYTLMASISVFDIFCHSAFGEYTY